MKIRAKLTPPPCRMFRQRAANQRASNNAHLTDPQQDPKVQRHLFLANRHRQCSDCAVRNAANAHARNRTPNDKHGR